MRTGAPAGKLLEKLKSMRTSARRRFRLRAWLTHKFGLARQHAFEDFDQSVASVRLGDQWNAIEKAIFGTGARVNHPEARFALFQILSQSNSRYRLGQRDVGH